MSDRSSQVWVWRASAIAVVLIGWAFIFFYNNMHLTPSVVFMALGFLAAVAAVYTLFKTGAAAVSPDDDQAGDAWGLPMGERAELEREKRTLLKAIKEAEFDHQMGKLSKQDAEHMIRTYRARAIAVIKMLDDPGARGGTVREQIEREVRARLAVDQAAAQRASKGAAAAKKKQSKQAAEAARKAARAAAAAGAPGPVAAAIAAAAAETADEDDGSKQAEASAQTEATAEAKAETPAAQPDGDGQPTEAAAAAADGIESPAPQAERDEREDKEATP